MKITSLAFALAAASLTACTSSFSELNTKYLKPEYGGFSHEVELSTGELYKCGAVAIEVIVANGAKVEELSFSSDDMEYALKINGHVHQAYIFKVRGLAGDQIEETAIGPDADSINYMRNHLSNNKPVSLDQGKIDPSDVAEKLRNIATDICSLRAYELADIKAKVRSPISDWGFISGEVEDYITSRNANMTTQNALPPSAAP